MQYFDLAIAIKWIYDKELCSSIENIFQSNSLSTFVIGTHNIFDITEKMRMGEYSFKAYLDRGSDEDENFEPIAKMISDSKTKIINDYENIEAAIDKAAMHEILLRENIPVPYTVIVPPYDEEKDFELSEIQKKNLGKEFIAKPSYYSGGGDGVLAGIGSINEIIDLRKEYSDDNIILQKKIIPIGGYNKRIWFRCFWFFNEAVPVWWNDITHVYEEINEEDFNNFSLGRLKTVTEQIAQLTGLEYFSCEATIDENNELILIDYINDQCDFRRKSQHHDGVPDKIVDKFINNMLDYVKAT